MKWLWLCFLLMGCAGGIHYIRGEHFPLPVLKMNIWVSPDFNEADRRTIDRAIGKWNWSLNGVMYLVETERQDADLRIFKISWKDDRYAQHLAAAPVEKDGKKKNILAWTELNGDIFVARDHIQDNMVEGAVMHELGHGLGAQHGGKLMAEYFNLKDYQCVDRWAIKKIGRVIKVNEKYFNYCQM